MKVILLHISMLLIFSISITERFHSNSNFCISSRNSLQCKCDILSNEVLTGSKYKDFFRSSQLLALCPALVIITNPEVETCDRESAYTFYPYLIKNPGFSPSTVADDVLAKMQLTETSEICLSSIFC